MCFTVNVNIVKEELESRYGASLLDPERYRPSYYYHAFAFPELPVALLNKEGDMQLNLFKWGLIPGWVRDGEQALELRKMTHNARSETVAEKASFSESYEHRRCLVPVSGFFEWQHHKSGKRPWYIYSGESQIMSLAGIYDRWYDDIEQKEVNTFSILTTRANNRMAEIHNSKKRMPVIIPKEHEETWLTGKHENHEELFEPLGEEMLRYHTVHPSLGKKDVPKNRPEIIEPYSYPIEPTLF